MARLDPHSYNDSTQPETETLDWKARVDFRTRRLHAEATLTLTRAALNDVIGGKTTYEQAVQSGAIQVSGDQAAAAGLFSLMDLFDPWFNIVTP